MTPTPPMRVTRARLAFACLVTLALALAACGGTSPTASVTGSTGAGSTDSQAPTAASPAAANQPKTIHVIEPGTSAIDVQVGSLTGCKATTSCQGDYSVGDDPLLDPTTNKQVGTILYTCFVVDPASGLNHCPAITLDLTGRGQIVYTSNVYPGVKWQPEPWPIIGGTGEFLGATGTVTSPQNQTYSGGEFIVTITN